MVGCVIASAHKLWGAGWHERFGSAHAEVNALRNATATALTWNQNGGFSGRFTDAPGQESPSMYVSLEPCCHTGKTPPCTKAIIESGIRRIVIGARDPNPRVNGGGIEALRRAGVQVIVDREQRAAHRLNAVFEKVVSTGLPWIIAKWAMTADGKIATGTGSSKWISNVDSRLVTHRLRASVDAVLVGSGTQVTDDPMLNVRIDEMHRDGDQATPVSGSLGHSLAGEKIELGGTLLVPMHVAADKSRPAPWRVVLDRRLRISDSSQLVRSATLGNVLIAHTSQDRQRLAQLERAGCHCYRLATDTPEAQLDELLRHLKSLGVSRVLVEGGNQLLGSLFDLRLVDEFVTFAGPKIAGGASSLSAVGGIGIADMPAAKNWQLCQTARLGNDTLAHYRQDIAPQSC